MSQKYGNEVKVITYSFYDNNFYSNESNGTLYKEFNYEGIPVIALKYIGNPQNLNLLVRDPILYRFAEATLRNEAPDVVHVGHPMRIHEFILAAQNLKIPYLITLTDFFLLCPKIILQPRPTKLCFGPQNGKACSQLCPEFNPDYIKARLEITKEILSGAKGVISPSNFSASVFNAELDELKIRIVPHGIRFSHIKENSKDYQNGDEIIFGYFGNLSYHKGVHVLLKAFKRIINDKISLKIYGSGHDDFEEKLKILASNDHRVSFEGSYNPENLGDVFNQIDVLVIPSLCYETYSFVLHEALACHVPVIGSNIGVMREKIKDRYTGVTFEPGDTVDLQRKIQLLIDYPATINQMKSNIKNEVLVATVEQEAYLYRDLYRSISI